MKIVFRRVGDRSFLASGLFPKSTTGTQSPTLRAVSLQVQLRLSFLRSRVFWHGCGCFRCHNPYLTQGLKKSPDGEDRFLPEARSDLPPIFVRVLNYVEQVHLRNRLKGELKGDVGKIRSCSLGDELTGIHEVARGKTNLASLYCGVGTLGFQAALFKQIQKPLLLSEAGEIPLFCHSRQKKIRIHSHLLSKRRDLGKNSLTLLIEPSL
jgi:hypothetical protein